MGKDQNGNNLGKGLSQRKDGRYEARAIINGIKIDIYDTKLSTLKKNFELAKQEARSKSVPSNNTTLNEWYAQWFLTCKSPTLKSEVSRSVYNRKVKNTYVRLLGDRNMNSITQLSLQKATNDLLDENYSKRSIKEAYGALRECFEIAVVNNIINANPCVGIKIKDDNIKQERRVLSHKEQETFLKEAETSYYYEAYKILLLTGMRIGEFSGLHWSDVDFENKLIHIRRSMQTAYINGKKVEELTTPKTNNSYRTIPFFSETEKCFMKWKEKQNIYKKKLGERWRANPELGDLVFTSTQGSPVTRYVLTHDLKHIVDNINMKECTKAIQEHRIPVKFEHLYPHAFRHTFATRCFEKDLDPIFVQSIMGHSNYATTVSYTHISNEMKMQTVSNCTEFLA